MAELDETADCPFCALAAGNGPAPTDMRWFEDVDVMAFSPPRPFVPGHTLVVPAEHMPDITDATRDHISAVMESAAEVGIGMIDETAADGFNIVTSAGPAATQTVFHWHVHVIPRRAGDDLRGWPWQRS